MLSAFPSASPPNRPLTPVTLTGSDAPTWQCPPPRAGIWHIGSKQRWPQLGAIVHRLKPLAHHVGAAWQGSN
eukprot:954447-Alexandrium_andersonii.AAC.1